MDWWLVRMAIWVRRPPSCRFITAAVLVIVLAAVVVTLERAGFWPQWAEAERVHRRGPTVEVAPVD